MSKAKNRPDIDTLLSERVRFEAWLDQLAAKSSKVPAHVAERVRADYQDRLAKVVEDLRSRSDELRAEAADLDERIALLESELTAKRDARAEDELRALVGEYDEAAWETKAAEHDEGIGRVDSERAARAADLDRVRELLAEATRPSRAMRRISEQDIPEEPTPVESTPAAPEAASPTDAKPVASGAVDTGFMSIDEALAAVEIPTIAAVQPAEAAAPPPPPLPPSPQPPPLPPPPAPTVKRPSPFDEIGFLRTVVGRATPFAGVEALPPLPPPPVPPPAAARPEPEPEPPRAAKRQTVPTFEAPPIPDVPAAAPARASSPAMPAFVDGPPSDGFAPVVNEPRMSTGSGEAARSLKCQECGWMNYPTEWYCEKCGGELAAF